VPVDIDLSSLIPEGLPDGREAVEEGKAIGRKLERAPSMYLEEKGFRSELEYRLHAREHGIQTTCMNLGLATWQETREALGLIYEDALRRGVRPPDRFNLLAERRMGLPKHLRADAPQETGPVLWTEQDWWELTHTVPIQAEAADNCVGGPGSLENVVDALSVGVTYVGVFTQYTWRWPYWDDEIGQTMEFLKAVGVLAALRSEGVCFDTYLDDGYPGVFHDYASYVGWAMLERFIARDLCGAEFSISWGGLTTDPITKSAMTLALNDVNDRVPCAFVQGDTIGNRSDIDSNFAVMSTDVLFMKMLDSRYKLGGAPIAVPVTETQRIPTWQEISTVQAVSRRLEDYTGPVAPAIDWSRIEAMRDVLLEGGTRFYRNAIKTLSEAGIDMEDPAALLFVIKRLGAHRCEELFGAGPADPGYPGGRRPIMQTDLVRQTMAERERLVESLATREADPRLRGRKVVVSSTDVHEFAEFLLVSTLEAAGTDVVDFGVNRDPEDIVKVALETNADAVVVTTHNGVARSFGARLREELDRVGMSDALVFMGGVLNEDVDGSDIPVDVRDDLAKLGVLTPPDIESLIDEIGERAPQPAST
jgi:methylmalonyl-CoA mutase cobalamin-binding domain/chain